MENVKNSYNASSNVFIMNCDEKEKPRNKHCHRQFHNTKKRQGNQHRRKLTYNSWREDGNSNYLQNMKVQRIQFKCIINLDTTVYEHKDHINNTFQRKHDSKTNYLSNTAAHNEFSKDRTVPCCFRHNCRAPRYYSRKSRERRCKKHYNHKPNMLSPISSSPLKDEHTNISIEDNFNKPVSYRDVSHETHNTCLDSKLDTLIKRTKERERKMREKSKYIHQKQPNTSTPLHIVEISSDEFPSSFSDKSTISLHSLSTFILEPQTDISSPEGQVSDYFYCPIKESLDITYSPSQIKPKLPENDQKNIKFEPKFDLKTVSILHNPTQLKTKINENKLIHSTYENNNNTYIKIGAKHKPYSPSFH